MMGPRPQARRRCGRLPFHEQLPLTVATYRLPFQWRPSLAFAASQTLQSSVACAHPDGLSRALCFVESICRRSFNARTRPSLAAQGRPLQRPEGIAVLQTHDLVFVLAAATVEELHV